MVKILLTSDIHLGIKDTGYLVPEAERLKCFKRICHLAKSHDIFLIAGDLFDNSEVDEKIIEIAAKEFDNIREQNTEIVYALGDQEINGNNIPSFLYNLNVSKLFTSIENQSCFSYLKDGQKIFIYGLPPIAENGGLEIIKNPDKGFHIGLFHVALHFQESGKKSNIYSLKKEDMASLNLDFYALGHYRHFKLFKSMNRYIGAYPGSPEAAGRDEKGDRYILSIEINDNEINQIKRLTVNSIKMEEYTVNCNDFISFNDIIAGQLNDASKKTFLTLILQDRRNFVINVPEIENLKKNFFGLRIEDRSSPAADVLIEEYSKEKSLRGEFFNVLKERLMNNRQAADIDKDFFSETLNHLIKNGSIYPEELLCD